MKSLASVSSLLSVLAIASVLLASAPAAAQTSKPALAAAEADSDGDELPDAHDPHPYIAEPPLTWRVGPMKIGWEVNDSSIETMTALSQEEKSMLKKKEYDFHRKVEAGTEVSTEVSAGISTKSPSISFGAEVSSRSRISASGGFAWSDSEQEQASALRRVVEQAQVTQHLSGIHIEFTVDFSNNSSDDYQSSGLSIPLKTEDGHAAAYAEPAIKNFAIPAKHGEATSIRFRADLNTQESRKLLQQVLSGTLPISLAASQGSIKSERGKDAIAAQAAIRRKTCEITIKADGSAYSYCIARRDEKTGKALALGDAFAALNELSPPGEAKFFHIVGKTLHSAFGQNNEVNPPRWWVSSADAGPEQDVNVEQPLPSRLHLRHRIGFPADMSRWLKLADADENDPWAALVTARLYYSGFGGAAQDHAKAVALWQKAAERGNVRALTCLALARMQGLGGLAKDEKKAAELLTTVVGLKDARALTTLGVAHMRGLAGFAEDEKKAVARFQEAAKLGDAHALTCLGLAHKNGQGGFEADEKKAEALFQQAYALGDMNALACLGAAALYGPEKDEKRAMQMIQNAAEHGDAQALADLGYAHLNGCWGAALDDGKAISQFQKATALGEARAIRNLGFAYHFGRGGLSEDDTEAVALFKQAVEFNDPVAMIFLALANLGGVGGLKSDHEDRAKLIKRASELDVTPELLAIADLIESESYSQLYEITKLKKELGATLTPHSWKRLYQWPACLD